MKYLFIILVVVMLVGCYPRITIVNTINTHNQHAESPEDFSFNETTDQRETNTEIER